MNMLTVSAAGAVIFAAYLVVTLYLLRLIAEKWSEQPWAQGLAALVH
jgi:hypothetical protein